MRTFVAVELTEELRAALVSARESLLHGVRTAGSTLGPTLRSTVRAVAEESLHVTVQFLGATPAESVETLCAALTRVARETLPFDADVAGFAAAPSASRPRVLWACIDDSDLHFRRLAERIGAELRPLGHPPEPRPFTPHITVARMRSGRADPRLRAALRERSTRAHGDKRGVEPIGTLAVRGLTLFQSVLDPRGARYTALCRAQFPSQPPASRTLASRTPTVPLTPHGADS